MTQFIVLLVLYVIIGSVIVLIVAKKKQTQEEFFIGGRTAHWIVTALTYAATTYSAFMMVGLVGMAYGTGVGAMIFELVYLAATVLILVVYGKRIWHLGKTHGYVSPMEMFADRYGKVTEALGAIVAFVALIPYASVQVIGLALVFGNYGIGFVTGVTIASLIIFVWAFLGGLRGVALTDALQGFFMMAVAIAVVAWTGQEFDGLEMSTFPNQVWTPLFFINITLPWAFFALTNPQVVQRLFIIKDPAGIKKMIILFAAFGLIYTVIVTVVGFAAKAGTLDGVLPMIEDRDTVIVQLMGRMGAILALPLGLSIIFASVSTSNSIILTLASMMTRDVFRMRKNMIIGRVFTFVMTLLVFLFALLRPDYLVELSVSSSRILLVFLPLYIGLFHWKRGGVCAGVFTVVGGAAIAVLVNVLGASLGSIYTFFGVFVLFFLGALCDRVFDQNRTGVRD
ncbi:MAG: sodium:solute symporter family protein [Spirochaetia bacterium]